VERGGGGGGITGHEAVALEVGEAALLKEDICFVEEEDCMGGGLVCGRIGLGNVSYRSSISARGAGPS
jgi:hypothetical protein